jgi:hypothetical protein
MGNDCPREQADAARREGSDPDRWASPETDARDAMVHQPVERVANGQLRRFRDKKSHGEKDRSSPPAPPGSAASPDEQNGDAAQNRSPYGHGAGCKRVRQRTIDFERQNFKIHERRTLTPPAAGRGCSKVMCVDVPPLLSLPVGAAIVGFLVDSSSGHRDTRVYRYTTADVRV